MGLGDGERLHVGVCGITFRAAITKHHTPGVLNHRYSFSLSSGGCESEIKVWKGPCSLLRPQKRLLPASSSLWRPGLPLVSLACGASLQPLLCHPIVTCRLLPVCLSLRLPSSLYKGTSPVGLGTILNQSDLTYYIGNDPLSK